VRTLGHVTDIDGAQVLVGVDYDSVTIGAGGRKVMLARTQCEEFGQLFIAACWEAGLNAATMLAEELPLAEEVR
jgi:hypothetical protein